MAMSESISFTPDPTFTWGNPVPGQGIFEGISTGNGSINFDGAKAGSNVRVIAGTSAQNISRLTNIDKLRFAVDFSEYDKVNQPFVNINTYLVSRFDGMVPVAYRDNNGNPVGNSKYYDAQGGGTGTYGVELDIFESNGFAFFQHTGHASDALFDGDPDPAPDANGGAWSYSSSSINDSDNMLNTGLNAQGQKVYNPPSTISSKPEANILVDQTYLKFRYEVDMPQQEGESMQIKRYNYDDAAYSGPFDVVWDSSWSFPGQNLNPVQLNSILDANQVGLYLFAGAQQGFVPGPPEYIADFAYPSDPRVSLGWSDFEAVYSDSYSAQGETRDWRSVKTRQSFKGSAQSDSIIGSETSKNKLSGLNGYDLLTGGKASDRLSGGAHADVLSGNAGRDRIFGGTGDDWINGGRGADSIKGGKGQNKFIYTSLDDTPTRRKSDTISKANFNGQDKIDVSRIVEDSSQFSFIGEEGFSGSGAEFRLDGNFLIGDLDGDSNGDFYLEFKKTDLSSLSQSDFII